jgi:hypothetical protein
MIIIVTAGECSCGELISALNVRTGRDQHAINMYVICSNISRLYVADILCCMQGPRASSLWLREIQVTDWNGTESVNSDLNFETKLACIKISFTSSAGLEIASQMKAVCHVLALEISIRRFRFSIYVDCYLITRWKWLEGHQ